MAGSVIATTEAKPSPVRATCRQARATSVAGAHLTPRSALPIRSLHSTSTPMPSSHIFGGSDRQLSHVVSVNEVEGTACKRRQTSQNRQSGTESRQLPPKGCRKKGPLASQPAVSGFVLGITALAPDGPDFSCPSPMSDLMSSVFRTPAQLLLLLALACSGGGTRDTAPSPEPDSQSRVRIENRASLDMDIYVVRSDGQRVRLGFVPGGETGVFALPAAVTSGAHSIQFEARPVRRSGQSVVSEPFGVRLGEEITWSVPPQ